MSLEYLTLNIHYDIACEQFEVSGNVSREGQHEIVEAFLRGQMGAGEDESKPNVQKKYNIELKWYPELDRIESRSDAGNKSLRDGILMGFLRYLEE